jgi:ribonucleoside-triphosphate reductase
MGMHILEPQGQQFVIDIIDTVNRLNGEVGEKYGYATNSEQVPAENSSIKLASKDALLGYQDKYALYSNQFIPLITQADLLDRIYLQGMFDSRMSGGAMAHLNVDTEIEDTEKLESLIEMAIKNGVVYHAVNYNLQRCEDGHMSVGKNIKCPICGKDIKDNFTRIVGFLVNVSNFHKVRREIDYPNRQFYHSI